MDEPVSGNLSSIVPDRRSVLTAIGGLSGGLAGCLDQSGTDSPTATPEPAMDTPANSGVEGRARSKELDAPDYGAINPAYTVWTCAGHDGTAYISARQGIPLRAAAYDLDDGAITANYTLDSNGYNCERVETGEDYAYFTTQQFGELFQLTLETGAVEKIAQLDLTLWGIAVAPDQTVYVGGEGSTVFEIDPESGEVTREFGQMAESEYYAYDLFATAESVFVGVGNTDNSGLYHVDRDSGESRQLFPDLFPDFTKKIDHNERYVLCHGNHDRSLVIDRDALANGEESAAHVVEPLPGQFGLAESASSRVYYAVFPEWSSDWPSDHVASGTESPGLYSYDVEERSHRQEFELPEAFVEDGLNYRSTLVHDGYFVGVGDKSSGKLVVYDVESGDGEIVDLAEAGMKPTGAANQSIGQFDGHPVTARNGALFLNQLPDGPTEKVTMKGEAKRILNVEDSLYVAAYTGARWLVYDGSEVRRLGRAKGQTRPLAIAYHDGADAVLMGTTPEYGGKTGGAVSVLDRSTESVQTHPNVVPDQSINALEPVGSNGVYVGSNLRRGPGTEAVAENAKVAKVDVESGETAWEIVPVEGLRRVLSLHRDGDTVFGVGDESWGSGVFFSLDTADRSVRESVSLEYTTTLQAGPGGNYYGVVASPKPPNDAYTGPGGLVVYDPEAATITRYHGDEPVFSFLGETVVIDDAIYYVDADSWTLRAVEGLGEY
jgi:hypothetical protein